MRDSNGNLKIWIELSNRRLKLKDYNGALRYIEVAISIGETLENTKEELAKCYETKAIILQSMENHREEIGEDPLELYARAISASPDDAKLHYKLANYLSWKGSDSEAVSEYKKSVELDPLNEDYNISWILGLGKLGMIGDAITYYSSTISEGGKNLHFYHLMLAIVNYRVTREYEKALSEVDKSLSLKKTGEALRYKVRVLRSLRRYSEAISVQEVAITAAPDDYFVYEEMAWIYRAANILESALSYFEKALALIEEKNSIESSAVSEGIEWAIANVLIRMERLEQAESIARKYGFHDLLALYYINIGDYKEAISELKLITRQGE